MDEETNILNPYLYIGRVKRRETGEVETIEVIYDQESVHIEDGDEFITFTTVVFLENKPDFDGENS